VATVLVTAAGAPGCPRLIRALREAGHTVVGTDANPRSAGSRLCDRFAVVPRGDDPGFIPGMQAAAAELGADLVFPTSSSEIVAWSRARDDFGLPVLAGPIQPAATARRACCSAAWSRRPAAAPPWSARTPPPTAAASR